MFQDVLVEDEHDSRSCPGTLGIADDVAVFGRTEIEHDANLHNVMIVSREHGLVFNSKTRQMVCRGFQIREANN